MRRLCHLLETATNGATDLPNVQLDALFSAQLQSKHSFMTLVIFAPASDSSTIELYGYHRNRSSCCWTQAHRL
jgi:hypothetical protein